MFLVWIESGLFQHVMGSKEKRFSKGDLRKGAPGPIKPGQGGVTEPLNPSTRARRTL